jgi:hypothetical protein
MAKTGPISCVSATKADVSASILMPTSLCGNSVILRVIFAAFFAAVRVIRENWLIPKAATPTLAKKIDGTRA